MSLGWRNSQERWGGVAMAFHWGLAALVLALIVLGWTAKLLPMSAIAQKISLFEVHKALGITALALMTLRLCWRLVDRAPVLPPTLEGWERRAAVGAHAALYAILIAMPISGWVLTSAANFPLSYFRLFTVPPLVAPSEAIAAAASTAHLVLFWLLAGLLLVHIGAALRHHFVLRDDILMRMLPIRR